MKNDNQYEYYYVQDIVYNERMDTGRNTNKRKKKSLGKCENASRLRKSFSTILDRFPHGFLFFAWKICGKYIEFAIFNSRKLSFASQSYAFYCEIERSL